MVSGMINKLKICAPYLRKEGVCLHWVSRSVAGLMLYSVWHVMGWHWAWLAFIVKHSKWTGVMSVWLGWSRKMDNKVSVVKSALLSVKIIHMFYSFSVDLHHPYSPYLTFHIFKHSWEVSFIKRQTGSEGAWRWQLWVSL